MLPQENRPLPGRLNEAGPRGPALNRVPLLAEPGRSQANLAAALTFAALAFAVGFILATLAFTALAFAFGFFLATLAFTALAFASMLIEAGQIVAATKLLGRERVYLG